MLPFPRRDFLKASGLTAVPLVLGGLPFAAGARPGPLAGDPTLRLGLIGCGGRGTGAAADMLSASPAVKLVAMGDVFPDRLASSLKYLKEEIPEELRPRVAVPEDARFTGFDAYQKVLAAGVDVVVLATPPGFRPTHFAAAVAAGKHVFMEKPVAVDAAGVRTVIAAAQRAQEQKLSVVAGTQRRHEKSYLEAIARIKDGAIGDVLSARCYWNQGGLWMNQRQPAWTDMEWQLRNWLYFTWLSGDHIVEQHVHNIDVCNWVLGTPARCTALGGRQARTGPEYGHVFDHFACEFEYASGAVLHSYCRQQDGTPPRVEEILTGTQGVCSTQPGRAVITPRSGSVWKFSGQNPNPYQEEQRDLVNAILTSTPINEGVRIAESTLTAIMGRLAAYTGRVVTWEQALNSKQSLLPEHLEMSSLPVPPVAIPGQTELL